MAQQLSEINAFLKDLNYEPPWIYRGETIDDAFLKDVNKAFIKKNTVLFHQNELCEKAYLIESGRFRVFYNGSNGNENCIYIAGEGSFLGEVSLIDAKPSFYAAIAIVDAEVYEFTKASLMSNCRVSEQFNQMLLKNLSQKIRALSSEIEFFSKPASTRVAISILSLANQYGKTKDDTLIIKLRFTHEEMGFLTNLNRVTVSNIFADLIRQEILKKDNGYLAISNLKMLFDMIVSN